jgi:hypothetical protein
MINREFLSQLTKNQLIDLLEDAAKNWLAHDGLWYLATEKAFDPETAIRLDAEVWERFSVLEARRIMKRLGIAPGGGVPALVEALRFRLEAHVNVLELVTVDERALVFRAEHCRVQSARNRKGLPEFPCKSVGLVGNIGFARTIDPNFRVRCLACPPDPHPDEFWCAWEFTLEDGGS